MTGPLGCGLMVGLGLLLLLDRGPRPAPPAAYGTGVLSIEATRAPTRGPLEAVLPTQPSQSPTAEMIETTLPTSGPAESFSNSWAEEIPDAACIPADIPTTGLVVDVIDGSSIRVLSDADGRVYSVRYLGLDDPGTNHAALQRNTSLVYRKHVLLVRDITDLDRGGSLLRYVLVDEVFVNMALVREGLAQVRMTAPDTACLEALLAAQREAQAAAAGIWADGD